MENLYNGMISFIFQVSILKEVPRDGEGAKEAAAEDGGGRKQDQLPPDRQAGSHEQRPDLPQKR